MKLKSCLFLILIGVIISLSACKKNNDAPTVMPTVGLNVINASVDTFNFYLNGSRKNSTSTILPGFSTGYYPIPQGQQSYQFKKPFNITTNTIQTLFSITSPADANQYHSLFITGEAATQAFFTIDTLKAVTATSDTCYIRFVNASSDAGSLDMSFGNVTLFKSLPFKTAGSFILVNTTTGASTAGFIALKVFSSGSTTPLVTDSVSLVAGKSYTFYSTGKLNGTGNSAFGVGTTINFN